MEMNRPSLYSAFGDKQGLYLQALERYEAQSVEAIRQTLSEGQTLRAGLRAFYRQAFKLYFPRGGSPRGCFLIGTATTESMENPHIRARLKAALRAFERILADRIDAAQRDGEPVAPVAPRLLASLASAVLHSIAIRSRAGESRATLLALADATVEIICGPEEGTVQKSPAATGHTSDAHPRKR
jgi:AcrR family transcriptional regulator